MTIRSNLLLCLADGKFHSGTELGVELGVSRMAVNKGINSLRGLGIDIHSVHGRGYRLISPIQVLQPDLIKQQLTPRQKSRLDKIEVLEKVESTNDYLMNRLGGPPPDGTPPDGPPRASASQLVQICLAEYQTQGRGRRGRQWVASPYRDLILSMARSFESGPATIAGLSLAAAVAVVQALGDYGVLGCGIKWPNDILWQGKKLGGLLVDLRGEISGPCHTVIGLGLNIGLQDQQGAKIDQPWVSLNRIARRPVERNKLAGQVIASMLNMLEKFEATGLTPFRGDWEKLHVYSGRRVEIRGSTYNGFGTVQGIDAGGALLIKGEGGVVRRCLSGEVSLRSL